MLDWHGTSAPVTLLHHYLRHGLSNPDAVHPRHFSRQLSNGTDKYGFVELLHLYEEENTGSWVLKDQATDTPRRKCRLGFEFGSERTTETD